MDREFEKIKPELLKKLKEKAKRFGGKVQYEPYQSGYYYRASFTRKPKGKIAELVRVVIEEMDKANYDNPRLEIALKMLDAIVNQPTESQRVYTFRGGTSWQNA